MTLPYGIVNGAVWDFHMRKDFPDEYYKAQIIDVIENDGYTSIVITLIDYGLPEYRETISLDEFLDDYFLDSLPIPVYVGSVWKAKKVPDGSSDYEYTILEFRDSDIPAVLYEYKDCESGKPIKSTFSVERWLEVCHPLGYEGSLTFTTKGILL